MALVLLNCCSSNVSGLEVKCDEKGAEVFLDGKSVGVCPVNLTPSAGNHVLTVKKGINADTYYFYESTIDLRNGESKSVSAKLGLRFKEEVAGKILNDFALVKGGCFQMGDIFGDESDFERPVHEVCLDDFYMGKYEVTQELWQKVTGDNPSSEVYHRLPVDNVSWNDAQKFITRLCSLTGINYRLPTEAEWEYAARSGGKWEKWAGTNNKDELPEYAWYGDNFGNNAHFVGLKKPNGLGLYDMTGNVFERVQDGWSRYEKTKQRNPQGAETMQGARYQNINRGGNNFRRTMGSIYRRDRYVGFRLAISASNNNQ